MTCPLFRQILQPYNIHEVFNTIFTYQQSSLLDLIPYITARLPTSSRLAETLTLRLTDHKQLAWNGDIKNHIA